MTGSDPEKGAGIVPGRGVLKEPAHVRRTHRKNDPTAAVTLCHHEDDVTTASAVPGRGAIFGEHGEEVPMSSINTVVSQHFCAYPARLSNTRPRDAHKGIALGHLPGAA
ncbi:hypothetical protein NRB20_04460 [Nocardia sp. RB20]|uniref:Uncharacterized protein n=1 Tax=Nocardia macrotermitis TaxID=2585198 RepID=A0A7K0CVH0_9NOCA|nr:hypothetical protein [Nocardia macrotermitis]